MDTAHTDGLNRTGPLSQRFSRFRLGCATIVVSLGLLSPVAAAETADMLLVPFTKLRIKAYQLNPTRGEYIVWDTISGDFTVAPDGTISIPLVGTIDAADYDAKRLPSVLSKALQKKVSLVSPPDISVEVVEYPPIYVTGQVTTPGEYRFRPGMTVLRALALSGGRYRAVAAAGSLDEFSLVAELKNVKTNIVRAKARIARLEAEVAGASSITLPEELATMRSDPLITGIIDQETLLFTTRKNALERQLKTLDELRTLYNSEIANLRKKGDALDASIKDSEDELGRVSQLVEKGIVTQPQKLALERDLMVARANRLDIDTTLMRAQQNLADSTRNSESLRDDDATRAATELQVAKTSLDELKVRESVSENLLGGGVSDQPDGGQSAMSYVIVRESAGNANEITADENTVLLPGDVLKVAIVQAKK